MLIGDTQLSCSGLQIMMDCYEMADCHIITLIPQGMNICQTRRAYATTFNPSSPLVTRLHSKNTLTASEHGFSILTLVDIGNPS